MVRNLAAPYHADDAVPSGSAPVELSEKRVAELIEFRRDLHAHPELARQELRTTAMVAERLRAAGLEPRVQPSGTGLVCDIEGERATVSRRGYAGRMAIRADLDALPIQEAPGLAFRSLSEGVSHACGHDVHTTVVLGTGLALAEAAERGEPVPATRLIFQPSEEVMPGGALDMIAAGALDGRRPDRLAALRPEGGGGQARAARRPADRRLRQARGAADRPRRAHLPAAADRGSGAHPGPPGHRAARGALPPGGPAARALAGLGRDQRGPGGQRDPAGAARRTAPCAAWTSAPGPTPPTWCSSWCDSIAAVYGAKTELDYIRGVPPVVNDVAVIEAMRAAATAACGPENVVSVEQSLGGEDFSWYLRAGARRDGPARRAHPGRHGAARSAPAELPGRRVRDCGRRAFLHPAVPRLKADQN